MTYPTIHPAMLPELNLSDPVAKANILLNAFRVAINGGHSVFNMMDGVVDEFEDETGVATKTGATYDSSNDLYHNEASGYTADLFPVMTSNTAPSGEMTASYDNGTWERPWFVTVGSTAGADKWQSNGGVPQWIKYDFGSGVTKTVTQYSLQTHNAGDNDHQRTPGTFTLQGSNNDSDWDVVDTQTGLTYTLLEKRTFVCGDPGAYRYYMLHITGAQRTDVICIGEWEMMESITPDDMTLVSDPFTAETEPEEGFVVLWEEDVDSVTLNTDIKAWATCDGSTFAQATLTEIATVGLGRILTGTADVSGQTGTTMKWKITTHNNKQLKVHAVGLEWS
jgi:hypothetical protein